MPATPGTSRPADPTPAKQLPPKLIPPQPPTTITDGNIPKIPETPMVEILEKPNERVQVLSEARACFMANSMKTKKLVTVLIKCIIILYDSHNKQGKPLTSQQATDLFFHVTHLFQYKHKDATLRRLTHIAIKLLSEQVPPNTTYVVTSSLMSDIGALTECSAIRASAIRATSNLLEDTVILKAIQSYMEQSLLSKHANIATASLVSLARLIPCNRELVKRYINHVQYVLVSGSHLPQYHALALLYKMAYPDPHQLSQVINLCIEQKINSPLTLCLLIRIITKYLSIITDDDDDDDDCDKTKDAQSTTQTTTTLRNFLKVQLSSNDQMVEYEAAFSIINSTKWIPSESSEHRAACSHMRNFLTSTDAALRFSSLRSLNKLACTLNADSRFWSCHRIGGVCKLHLLNKSYRIGDHITGILDFTNSNITCAKYTIILQCEDTQYYELKQEFSLGLEKTDFMIAIPALVDSTTTITTTTLVLHCVLSFLFYIVDKSYPKTLYEDRTGTIEVGATTLDTKLFSCDFPIAVYM